MSLFSRLFPFFNQFCILLAGGFLLAANAHAAETTDRWVSDNLSTIVRSGPTDGFRVIGMVKSGQKVQLLNTQGDYSQIRGESGDTVWLPSANLQEQPSPSERLPALTQQVGQLNDQLKTIDDSWKTRVQGMQETLDARKKLIDELQAHNKQIDAQLTDAQTQVRTVQAQLGDENKQVLMRYMAYGGAIAGAGLLVGLLLPLLMRGRKRNDRWF